MHRISVEILSLKIVQEGQDLISQYFFACSKLIEIWKSLEIIPFPSQASLINCLILLTILYSQAHCPL